MANAIIAPGITTQETSRIPPLEQGDRLTRDEFERRYRAQPNLKKAELIEGVVHMPSPVRQVQHGEPQFNLNGVLLMYRAWTPGVRGGDNSSLLLDLDNEPQPDGLLFIEPERGGQAKINEEGYIVGAPELIGEIAASSVSYDLHVKFNVYRRSGVKEYVVWRVEDRAIDWFVLRGGDYVRLELVDGAYRSEVFPGLWLDVEAMLSGNLQQVAKRLQQGIACPEHAAFVALLQGTK